MSEEPGPEHLAVSLSATEMGSPKSPTAGCAPMRDAIRLLGRPDLMGDLAARLREHAQLGLDL